MLQEGLLAAAELEARLARWQLQRLLGGPYDEDDALLSIQAWPFCPSQKWLHVQPGMPNQALAGSGT